jgi:hypothetical protein
MNKQERMVKEGINRIERGNLSHITVLRYTTQESTNPNLSSNGGNYWFGVNIVYCHNIYAIMAGRRTSADFYYCHICASFGCSNTHKESTIDNRFSLVDIDIKAIENYPYEDITDVFIRSFGQKIGLLPLNYGIIGV